MVPIRFPGVHIYLEQDPDEAPAMPAPEPDPPVTADESIAGRRRELEALGLAPDALAAVLRWERAVLWQVAAIMEASEMVASQLRAALLQLGVRAEDVALGRLDGARALPYDVRMLADDAIGALEEHAMAVPRARALLEIAQGDAALAGFRRAWWAQCLGVPNDARDAEHVARRAHETAMLAQRVAAEIEAAGLDGGGLRREAGVLYREVMCALRPARDHSAHT